jgi:hypothetical protein
VGIQIFVLLILGPYKVLHLIKSYVEKVFYLLLNFQSKGMQYNILFAFYQGSISPKILFAAFAPVGFCQ